MRCLWEREIKKNEDTYKSNFFWFLEKGREGGFLTEEDTRIIARALNFGKKMVKEIMVPAAEVVCAEVNTPIQEIVSIIIEQGHTRIPIYQDNFDNVVGILHAKNLLKVWAKKEGQQEIKLTEILHPPLFVPETKKIGGLLKEMNARHMHLAVVVDEYGSTAGIVSLEDIVEEIFGEIQDEYDKEMVKAIRIDEHTWRVKANIDLEELEEILGVSLPKGKYETLAGFIINLTGKVPKKKEIVRYKNLVITIINATPRRIQEVIIKKDA